MATISYFVDASWSEETGIGTWCIKVVKVGGDSCLVDGRDVLDGSDEAERRGFFEVLSMCEGKPGHHIIYTDFTPNLEIPTSKNIEVKIINNLPRTSLQRKFHFSQVDSRARQLMRKYRDDTIAGSADIKLLEDLMVKLRQTVRARIRGRMVADDGIPLNAPTDSLILSLIPTLSI
jgi:hypothetical protein